ncbi:MAG: hypothetical protein GY721_11975 [Deltaproteobacteria bacterium]|nr:hypothetical protein [Deltaproteobacteria bacterium]
METSRKKALQRMQKGIVAYQLNNNGWDVSDHLGDGCDFIAEKNHQFIKIELKAIDLAATQEGKNATQHLSANELVSSSHLIITVFDGIQMQANYIMSIRQFVENSGVKKYESYRDYKSFMSDYIQLAREQAARRKNATGKKNRLDFDFNFNPRHPEKWRLATFKDQWNNLA